jgi:hypothetical protein
LDQSLESSFEVPSPPHVEYLSTSSKYEFQLDDVIERIERMNFDGNATPSQSMEQLGPSQKYPKWHIKTLESVHPNEVGKIGTKISTRQDDGGGVDNSDSGDVNDMGVSFDCELNLSTNIEPTSFQDNAFHDEWK